MARRCGGSTAKNCLGCDWWPPTAIGPAWCWPNRGVSTSAHEAELTGAPTLLAAFPLAQRLVTGDALYCQRELCRRIVADGGAYFFSVGENQPRLYDDLYWLFEWPAPDEQFAAAVTHDKHGDRIETRRLWVSTALVGYSDWPGLQQALRLERRTIHKRTGVVLRQETAYAVTSLPPRRATPPHLLALWRGHWSIENRLHYVRDVAFDEDRATVRAKHAPQVMAAFRNAAIGVIRRLGTTKITATCRQFAAQPHAALVALGACTDLE
jgi:predicted transposase YbfD/YdcC